MLRGGGQIGGELQAFVAVALEQLGEKIFMDGHAARAQHGNLLLVVVDADDGMSDLREAHRSHQPYIARTHHRD